MADINADNQHPAWSGVRAVCELALLAGSLLDRIGAVVALVKGHDSWAGIDAGGAADAPALTFCGQPIPYAPIGPEPSSHSDPSTGAIVLRSAFAAVREDPGSVRAAEIPVGRTRGPILLVSGEDDHVWSATAGFKQATNETVLVQSKTLTVRGATFRSAVEAVVGGVSRVPVVTHLPSPLDHAGRVAKDGRSRLVQFELSGDADTSGATRRASGTPVRVSQRPTVGPNHTAPST
jgi:hypothetical protein